MAHWVGEGVSRGSARALPAHERTRGAELSPYPAHFELGGRIRLLDERTRQLAAGRARLGSLERTFAAREEDRAIMREGEDYGGVARRMNQFDRSVAREYDAAGERYERANAELERASLGEGRDLRDPDAVREELELRGDAFRVGTRDYQTGLRAWEPCRKACGELEGISRARERDDRGDRDDDWER